MKHSRTTRNTQKKNTQHIPQEKWITGNIQKNINTPRNTNNTTLTLKKNTQHKTHETNITGNT